MEQEYKAEAQNMRAKVIAAEAEVPLAIAEAFRKATSASSIISATGTCQADTAMRQSIAGPADGGPASEV
jgi:uncharacterized protein YqfA (UPF0365 family)